MKLMALLGAGALAAGTMAAVPAEAQRWDRHDRGYRDHGYGHGRFDDRGWRGHRWDRGGYGRHWDRGYRGGRYAYGGGYYGRPRVVCRLHRGYYGPVRRCFRAY